MIVIDGSKGEGGGQIVRSSLALSAITGKPFTIDNVRAGRKKPGLMRQHLTAVNAATEICSAKVEGAELKSNRLVFNPGPLVPGDYHFKIGTAGSAALVTQTVVPALLMADGPSEVQVEGGTHNPMAPSFDYLNRVYLPLVSRMGPSFETEMIAYGFYPAGGGHLKFGINPCAQFEGLELMEREGKLKPTVTAVVSRLPAHVGERECELIRSKMNWDSGCCRVIEVQDPRGPGNVLMIELASDNVREMFTGFGAPGVRAEQVARAVLREARAYMAAANVPVGEHLADQLMLPMGLAATQGKTSRFVTVPLSQHSLTHKKILELFLDVSIKVEQHERVSTVTIVPK